MVADGALVLLDRQQHGAGLTAADLEPVLDRRQVGWYRGPIAGFCVYPSTADIQDRGP